eukprot:Sspe_Gene.42478::Locus_20620_Transcript_1_1_Confidence_1.000_Length_981::g.42478::m.42478
MTDARMQCTLCGRMLNPRGMKNHLVRCIQTTKLGDAANTAADPERSQDQFGRRLAGGQSSIPARWLHLPDKECQPVTTRGDSSSEQHLLCEAPAEMPNVAELERRLVEPSEQSAGPGEGEEVRASAESDSEEESEEEREPHIMQYRTLSDATVHAFPGHSAPVVGELQAGTVVQVDGLAQVDPGSWARVCDAKGSPYGWMLQCRLDGSGVALVRSDRSEVRASEEEEAVQQFIRKHSLNSMVSSALLDLPPDTRAKVMGEEITKDWGNLNALVMHRIRIACGEEDSAQPSAPSPSPSPPPP